MTTGQRIKAARKAQRMTQSELAAKLCIPYQSISQYERDLRNPKYETLLRIADALGVNVLELLGENSIPDSYTKYCYSDLEQRSSTGQRIKYARNQLGMSVDDLAQKLSISASTVNRYEAGKISLSSRQLKEIGQALEVNEDWLLGLAYSDSSPLHLNRSFFDFMADVGFRFDERFDANDRSIKIEAICDHVNFKKKTITEAELEQLRTDICKYVSFCMMRFFDEK